MVAPPRGLQLHNTTHPMLPSLCIVRCLQEPLDTSVLAGSAFPRSAATQGRYQAQVGQPQTSLYSVNYQPPFNTDFKALVLSVRSKNPFTGTYLDYMTQALLGKPSEFDLEVYLAGLVRNCNTGAC